MRQQRERAKKRREAEDKRPDPDGLTVAERPELHAAAKEGRLADMADGLLKKQAAGQLAAGTPCRTPPSSPCPLSPAPGLCGGSAGGAGR